MATEYYWGQGRVWIAPRASNGSLSGAFAEVGDADALNLNVSQSFLDVYESQTGNRNNSVHVPTQTDWDFEMQVLNIDGSNLARAFYGNALGASAAVAVVDEAVTGYESGTNFVKHLNVSSFSIEVSGGTGALVLDTDYSVDLEAGSFTILPGHTHADLAVGTEWSLLADYTYTNADRVEFNKNLIGEYSVIFEGVNVVQGQPVRIHLKRIALNLSTTFNMIDTAENRLTLGGRLLPDPDATGNESTHVSYEYV